MEIEQPLILDWFDDKYAHIQVESLLYECVIEDKWLESIEVWIHEFIEQDLLDMESIQNCFIILEDEPIMPIAHIVTSLSVSSGWKGETIYPDQFWDYLMLG